MKKTIIVLDELDINKDKKAMDLLIRLVKELRMNPNKVHYVVKDD